MVPQISHPRCAVVEARIVKGAIPAAAPPVVGKARFIKQAALGLVPNAGGRLR